MELKQEQLAITHLGPREVASPLDLSVTPGDQVCDYTSDDMQLLFEPRVRAGAAPESLALELAGPREKLFFPPAEVKAAIVTCGGLCPGLNNVIRAIVQELQFNYGVDEILGIRHGYAGLNPEQGRAPIKLDAELVSSIHHTGGTILGTSRGPQDPRVTVEFLASEGVNILFCIGGDGTQRGAHAIAQEVARRELPIAVVGIPKTIDNDIKFCFSTFGFYTAVAEAESAIDRAHVEAKSVLNGVGLVKLMGREAGFIAAAATLASGEVNFCLIPEEPFQLDGEHGLLARLKHRLEAREHAVIVVAEGAGQHLLAQRPDGCDASGNVRLGDIGYFLKAQIQQYCGAEGVPVSVKYFDPSYQIRSVSATAVDSLLCERFARAAVHAAMAGKTDVLIGLWHNQLVHVPLAVSTGQKKQLDLEGELWSSVLAVTGQEKW
ncbi:MAG: diphosphate--fructose-6-phosphate 1-phosphotransferase [Planctomycetaceae bacterium]|nr:diphosphate--fructose-6-phosphate 1-phosphotransferase [Planctomycetaceae bacterium]